jgi:antitoxin component YwqK of YwqJK toxin-antitoxin module
MLNQRHCARDYLFNRVAPGVLTLCLALATPSAFAVEDCEFNGKSINTNNGAETAGKTGMVLCKDRDSGLRVREYELRNGDSVGLSRYFKLCGFAGAATVNSFSHKGDLRSTSLLVAGVEQKSTSFYSNGKPELEEELVGAQKRETFYADNGSKRREKVWEVTARPGQLLREAEFHTSGTMVMERAYTLVETDGRKRSRLSVASRFYLNGQPQSKDTYTLNGNTETRETQRFTDQGKLKAKVHYVLDSRYGERPLGTHQFYFANGVLAEEESFDDKGNPIRQKAWDETGELLSDDEVFEDGSRKAFAR